MIVLAKLVACEQDIYTTYVFECLEDKVNSSKYVMTIRYPNWNDKILKLGDIGYLHFEERRAGIDKWFDGKEMVPYSYDTVQYIKFIYKPEDKPYEYVM